MFLPCNTEIYLGRCEETVATKGAQSGNAARMKQTIPLLGFIFVKGKGYETLFIKHTASEMLGFQKRILPRLYSTLADAMLATYVFGAHVNAPSYKA